MGLERHNADAWEFDAFAAIAELLREGSQVVLYDDECRYWKIALDRGSLSCYHGHLPAR